MISAKIGIRLIQAYQKFVSPLFAPRCRFFPSCSQYAIEALQKYGLAKGMWVSAKRLTKCHPFHPGGYDPV